MTRPDPRREVFADIERLNLQSNVMELEENGYTVIERLLDDDTVGRAQQAILDQLERKTGSRPDLETFDGELPLVYFLLFKNPVFEEILMNERMLALSTYLLGQSFLLSSMICHARGPKNANMALHADTPGPQPYGRSRQRCQLQYCAWWTTKRRSWMSGHRSAHT